MVYILLADGFEEVEALTPVDALRRARVDVALVGVTGMTVAGSHGVRVEADIPLEKLTLEGCEALIVPGGLRGVQNIKASEPAMRAILAAHRAGKRVCAICAAPTVLAGLGILDGRRAVCYPGMEDELAGAEAKPGESVVVDGSVITSRSAGTAWDFALTVLSELRGPEAAKRVCDAVHYDYFKI